MTTRSKNYRKAAEKIDRSEVYAPLAAVRLAKEGATTKFDSTVESNLVVAPFLARRTASSGA